MGKHIDVDDLRAALKGTEYDKRGLWDLINATPDPRDDVFEWCHDCKEYDKEAHCCPKFTKVIMDAVKEVGGKWQVGAPTDAEYAILTIVVEGEVPTVDVGRFENGELIDLFVNYRFSYADTTQILAWMPLPPIYWE